MVMNHQGAHGRGGGNYGKLFLALGLNLLVMFPLTMAFVARWSDFHLNLSTFSMALTMVAPMGLIMLGVMRGMFPSRRLNPGLAVGFVALFGPGCGWGGRRRSLATSSSCAR